MSRSKKDWNDTESMLTRLTNLLVEHASPENKIIGPRADAESLRRISMTLHRWHEGECGDSNQWGAWVITRGKKEKGVFTHDDDGAPFYERHWYYHGKKPDTVTYELMVDKERGAKRRLASIMARYPTLTAYIQTDPRGCALYILKPGDVPEGADVSAYYSRGLAVYR